VADLKSDLASGAAAAPAPGETTADGLPRVAATATLREVLDVMVGNAVQEVAYDGGTLTFQEVCAAAGRVVAGVG